MGEDGTQEAVEMFGLFVGGADLTVGGELFLSVDHDLFADELAADDAGVAWVASQGDGASVEYAVRPV
jgi:hypothetical protein